VLHGAAVVTPGIAMVDQEDAIGLMKREGAGIVQGVFARFRDNLRVAPSFAVVIAAAEEDVVLAVIAIQYAALGEGEEGAVLRLNDGGNADGLVGVVGFAGEYGDGVWNWWGGEDEGWGCEEQDG